MVSIIIPVYNSAKFLSKTIDNLLSQKVDKEIILVNDGSTDNSLEICLNYKNKHTCVKIINKENAGVSAARNSGIAAANGEYIIFVDSDDFLEDGALERCVNIFKQYPSIDCVTFSFCRCRKDMTLINADLYKDTGWYTTKDWLLPWKNMTNNCILNCIGTKVYKTRIINEHTIRFNESISYCEDISFATMYLMHTKCLYYINEPLYLYMFINDKSLMQQYKKNFPQSIIWQIKCVKEMLDSVCGTDFPTKEFLEYLPVNYYILLTNELRIYPTDKTRCLTNVKFIKSVTDFKTCIKYSNSLKLYCCFIVFKLLPIPLFMRLLYRIKRMIIN